MWIDTNRLRFDDFNPNEQLDDSELMTAQEQAEFERELDERERDEQAQRDAMEREQDERAQREAMERGYAAMDYEATEDYPF